MSDKWLKKKKILYVFGSFLALMFLCYLVSRGVYASGLPFVDTQKPTVMGLSHNVKASGNVSQDKEEALLVPAGLPVCQVAVRAGDQVEEGDLLFTLDMESLEDYIQERQVAISKLELQISALEGQEKQDELEKQETLKRALEDLEDAKETADRNLQRAKEDASAARNDLTDHQNDQVQVTGQEERNRQQAAYDSWCSKVNEAQKNYEKKQKKEASLKEQITVLEQEIAEIESKLKELTDGGTQGAGEPEISDDPTVSGNEGGSSNETDSQKEKLDADLIEKKAELEGKQKELAETQSALEAALATLKNLQSNPVSKPDFSAEDAAQKVWKEAEESLEKSVQSADRGIEDAQTAKEEALKNANRKLEDAGEPDSQDNTLESIQLELSWQKEQLQEYEQLKEEKGQITAEQGGIITQVNVTTGGLTSAQAAVVFAAKDSPFIFEAFLTKEQKQYVSQGAKVTIKLADGRSLQGKVDYLTQTVQGDGSYQAAVKLEQGTGNLGQSGTLETTFQTEQFACCIPLDALYTDANQRNYVYTLAETEGFLGVELSARKVFVTVLDKNEVYAAIEPGVLSAETQLITYATKEFKDGTIVRMR